MTSSHSKVRVAEPADGIRGIYAYIGAVLAGGLAERSGLRAGDRVTKIGFMVLADIIYPDQVMEFLREDTLPVKTLMTHPLRFLLTRGH